MATAFSVRRLSGERLFFGAMGLAILALVFGPHWREVVLDPWFLASVAAFGVASARLYWNTGSLWPPVALHWMVVVAWKALLGGPSPWMA